VNNKYNIWNKWDPLKTVVLGDCYGPDFFRDIKNHKIRSALTQIAEETQEDLEYYQTVLKDFGCNVLRPKLDRTDSIMNYINEDGKVFGTQGVPGSPLQPRNNQLVIGNRLLYTGSDHSSMKNVLDEYNDNFICIDGPLSEASFDGYKGNNAPSWPMYEEYLTSFFTQTLYSQDDSIQKEFEHIHVIDKIRNFLVPAPSITVMGKDLYIDVRDIENSAMSEYYLDKFKEQFSNFRCNILNIGGHSDGCFHTLKPGAILSLYEIQRYTKTFPNWDICYLPNQSWSKVDGFLKIKEQVGGKWWVPDQEENYEFTNFVETWLQDWVGYVEETVFDVNVLVLDEHHVCVNNMNPTVIDFLKKHNMEAVHVPWRHRYFWDGGLHCITLDLYREGTQQDLFPNRKTAIADHGFD